MSAMIVIELSCSLHPRQARITVRKSVEDIAEMLPPAYCSAARNVPASCSYHASSSKPQLCHPHAAFSKRIGKASHHPPARMANSAQAPDRETVGEAPSTQQAEEERPDDIADVPSADDTIYPLPSPREFQQTLKRSFCLGGIGLHSGDYAYVRVRPAFAGEGRYFVRVPQGTNERYALPVGEDGELPDEDGQRMSLNEEEQDLITKRFLEYLQAQDRGYNGSFEEYHWDTYGAESPTADVRRAEQPSDDVEQPVRREVDEEILQATVANVVEGQTLLTSLASGNLHVHSVEALLSALECCGVDNARIEMEGGYEVPVVDGSAQGWALNTMVAGLQPAHSAKGKGTRAVHQRALRPSRVVSVQEGDAFVSFYPAGGGGATRVSAGLDAAQAAPVIGRQWFSWAPTDGGSDHYRWAVAPARTFYRSLQEVYEQRARGMVRGGTIGAAIIGYGHDWYELETVRFYNSEPARHKVVDLTGDLALLARNGSRGIPIGHTVSHNADHALQLKFLKALHEAISVDDYVLVDAPASPAA